MATATLNGKQEITIKDVGPISGTFHLDLSPGPGLYVLGGGKGVGKSHTIECVELLAGHQVQLSLHDGAFDGGVSGFGVSVPIGKQRLGRRKGEFEATALDQEKYTVEDITDPPIKDPVKADAHRIKALASIVRVKLQPADFYSLLGGRDNFEDILRTTDLSTDDPVVLMSRIKGAIDNAARFAESQTEREEGQAEACKAAAAGIDLNAESNPIKLAKAVDQAVAAQAKLETLYAESVRSRQQQDSASARLAKAKADYKGPSLGRAEAMVGQASNDHITQKMKVDELREQLRAAEIERDKAAARLAEANSALTAARQHAELIGQLEELIQQTGTPAPTQEQMTAAANLVAAARADQENGVRIRDAIEALEKRQQHLDAAEDLRLKAKQLRSAAASTFEVLSRAIQFDAVKIVATNAGPRLVYQHPVRGETPFSELSDGERVRATIDLLMPLFRAEPTRPGVFPIPQRLYQDLAPSDAAEIDEFARERGIFVFGARVDSGPLRCEKWEG